ncbi:hypothetical protein BJ322DRAFT_880139 [Thelephora terrestris]|uniref:Uncharacterized protein n=1 Tax=Thelephora terrestris TaxID=56493 RepID=A0A9P6HCF5_9AGAM|nr:hypothetical protein BJ322DRAFT_880139 [Thelephora terrestris]
MRRGWILALALVGSSPSYACGFHACDHVEVSCPHTGLLPLFSLYPIARHTIFQQQLQTFGEMLPNVGTRSATVAALNADIETLTAAREGLEVFPVKGRNDGQRCAR